MKINFCMIILLLLCNLLFSGANESNGGKSEEMLQGFKLVIKTEKETYKVSENVIISVKLINVSNSDLYISRGIQEKDYRVIATDVNKEELALTKYGEKVKNQRVIGYVRVDVKPNEELAFEIKASRMFDMTLTGEYLFFVKRRVVTLDGKGFVDVISNIVRIKVVDD